MPFALICDVHNLKSRLFARVRNGFLVTVDDSGHDADRSRLHTADGCRCERNQDRRKNIGHNDVVFPVSDLILNLLIVRKISENHMKARRIDAVCLQIIIHGRYRTGIKIRRRHASAAEHQGENSQDSASGSDVEKVRLIREILPDLPDAQLRRLMHTRAECRAGVNVKYKARLFLPVSLFRLLPGRDAENIIDPELVKILFPVVDPVLVLRLVHGDRSVPDNIGITPELIEALRDSLPDFLGFSLASVRHLQRSVFVFLYVKTQNGSAVIGSRRRADIDKHLLFLCSREGNIVLDLGPLKADIFQLADDDVFRIDCRADSETHPLHKRLREIALLR